MSFKVFSLASLLLVSSQMASAQVSLQNNNSNFMGIGKLAVTESFAPKVLMDAIESQNIEIVNNWKKEKGLTFPYDNKAVCFASNYSLSNQSNFDEKKITYIASNLIDGSYPIFTSCDRIPLLKSVQSIRYDYTPSFSKYVPGFYESDRTSIQKTAKKLAVAEMFLDSLQDNQWEQLLPIITDSQMDFEFRKKAIQKFQELYFKKGAQTTAEQKVLFQSTIASAGKNRTSYDLEKGEYLRASSPVNYLFQKNLQNFVENSREASLSNVYKNGEVPKLTVAYFTGKAPLDIDAVSKKAASFGYDKWNPGQRQSYIQTLQNFEILRIIMSMKGVDVNKQDPNGNTVFHNSFKKSTISYSFSDNAIAANFTRAILSMGANPMLLNNENKTAYMIIKEKGGTSESYKFILDAFESSNYVDK